MQKCEPARAVRVLLAQNDEDDLWLVKAAIERSKVRGVLDHVRTREELMDYLYRRKSFKSKESAPMPDLMLVDLRLGGKRCVDLLKELEWNGWISEFPVVVVLDSQEDIDYLNRNRFGGILCVLRPSSYREFIRVVKWVEENYLELNELTA